MSGSKIGIITIYYNNINYGAALQSYALQRVIAQMGFDAEQICFQNRNMCIDAPKTDQKKLGSDYSEWGLARRAVYKVQYLVSKFLRRKILHGAAQRQERIIQFEQSVPHSEKVWTRETITGCAGDYDAFVTGSDQVWNMDWYNPEYFLNFVPDDKPKISYAASMPNPELDDRRKDIAKKHLSRFDRISVREEQTAHMLEEMLGRQVVHCVDPTLLLSREEWDRVCEKRPYEKKYVFCYFLCADKNKREQARRFADSENLEIITLPYLNAVKEYQLLDTDRSETDFADVKLYDISPGGFLALIKYAEYVITDSFHAALFANLYGTEYFVFDRTDVGRMNSRIVTLLRMCDSEERFCAGENLDARYMLSLKGRPVPGVTEEMERRISESRAYLEEAMETVKKRSNI